jgi:hypothetical protein
MCEWNGVHQVQYHDEHHLTHRGAITRLWTLPLRSEAAQE